MAGWKDKIITDHEELKKKLDSEKEKGRKIVFTNGGFDILHVGHLRSMFDAKRAAEVLVVALNTDESIKKNKGPHLPVNPLEERMEVLAAIECVDYVTSFGDRTVDPVLLKLKPDFHAKGTDYTEDTVPERETVFSYGGKILIVGDPKDHSSTGIMDRILNSGGKKSE